MCVCVGGGLPDIARCELKQYFQRTNAFGQGRDTTCLNSSLRLIRTVFLGTRRQIDELKW